MSKIEIGSKIEGTDVHGNDISGVVTNVMNIFGIAQVRYGEDRLQISSCEVNNIRLVEE